ncbi:Uncharacterised protein [Mycobacterium tuberculosis]|nr:Uncharacterised protein [Mycobacterium tuberculosis]
MSGDWKWIINDLKSEIAFYEQNGFDKEQPELFARMKTSLERAVLKQQIKEKMSKVQKTD